MTLLNGSGIYSGILFLFRFFCLATKAVQRLVWVLALGVGILMLSSSPALAKGPYPAVTQDQDDETEEVSSFPAVDETAVTPDGVTLVMHHLKNAGRPIVVLAHGLSARGMSLQVPALDLYKDGDKEEGYDVRLLNFRGAVKLKGEGHLLGDHNGLEEITRIDLPTQLRYIIKSATKKQLEYGITYIGHSRGGMAIMALMADPQLWAEFAPYIRAWVLLQAPHHLKYLRPEFKAVAWAAKRTLIPALRKQGVRSVNLHSHALYFSKDAKENGGILKGAAAAAMENFVIGLTRFVFDPSHTGRQQYRDFIFKALAHAIPVDELEDFANAVLNDGEFVDSHGQPLMNPAVETDIPFLVVRSTGDTLAPWDQMGELYDLLKSPYKVRFDVHTVNHINSLLQGKGRASYYRAICEFIKNPKKMARENPIQKFKPPCANLLTKLGATALSFIGI